jgi:hypothetical protein
VLDAAELKEDETEGFEACAFDIDETDIDKSR